MKGPLIGRRSFAMGLCSCAAGLTAGCLATTDDGRPIHEIESVPLGYKPSKLDSDEAGLWLELEKEEEKVKKAGNLIKEQKLQAFIDDMCCRVSGKYCPDTRRYVLRVPSFNASMAPNGVMNIWSGLLLRCNTESQLAAVIGHEFAHYLRRHSLQKFRDARSRQDLVAAISLGVAVAGLPGAITDLTALAVKGGYHAFSRDNEREADAVGLELLADAGYDPFEAPEIWARFDREMEPIKHLTHVDPFTASHPPREERKESLLAAARKRGRPKEPPLNRLPEVMKDFKLSFMLDEIKKNRHDQTLALFDVLVEDNHRLGEVLFAKGELFRHRNKRKDIETALDLYQQALANPFGPPETHRSLGLIHHKAGRKEEAATHLKRYLDLRPNALDREMLKSYIGMS